MAFSKGVGLSFGLINAIVTVDTALETKVGNKMVCTGITAEHAPVKISQVRRCTDCGDIPFDAVRKAREVAGGYVLLEAGEIQGAKVDAAKHKKLASLTPHPAEDVEANTIPGDKLYYLTPEGDGQAYAVLRHLVHTRPDLTFLTLWTPRSSAGIFAVRVRGDVLVLQERVAATATKPAPPVTASAPDALLAMAEQMLAIDGIVAAFDADKYADTYEAKIQEILAGKIAMTGKPDDTTSTPVPTTTSDLMSNLAAFVAEASKPKSKSKPPKKVSA